MSEHYDFHYQPTGSGAISGQQVLEQTEDAINELGDYVYDNVGGAMDVAQEALETAQNAQNDAQTALDTANSFSDAIQSAQQNASTALSTAQTAQTTATNANNTAIQASQDASSAVTTANNASGQVSTLSGTVTALGQRVTTAEGNIGQNTSDITALTTRVGTAEGNITTLQNDVTIAQGNASSAMATAGTVKQQSYVLRYSSATLVASSTNSNSLLDNTDNLKVGDKVLDSSGNIYVVTAIDTANSTFTIGTSLIDLAQDSDVVHKSGDETISGNKTFSSNVNVYNSDNTATTPNLYLKSSKTELSSQGNTSGGQDLTWLDKNNTSYAYVKGAIQSNGGAVKIRATAKDSSNNSVINELQILAYTNGNKAIFPAYSNETDLGVSNYKWKSIFATNYYYGNDNVEFSTKFVTTDTAQTVSGSKTYNDLQIIGYGTQYKGARNAYILPEFAAGYSGLCITTLGFAQTVKIGNFVLDANNKPTLDASKGYIQVATGENNGVNACRLEPKNSTSSSLGTSSNKWSGIYATNYYYGANNTEFSQKFVTTDTAQTVSGAKTFSEDIVISNSDTSQTSKRLVIRSSKVNLGDSNSDSWGIAFNAGASFAALIASEKSSNYMQGLSFTVRTKDTDNNLISASYRLRIYTDGSAYLIPNETDSISLGSSSNKWKDVQTNKINGLEPSSLSLPSGNANDVIDISSYITALDGTSNSYTVPANGWISIAVVGTAIAIVSSSWSDSRLRASSENVRMLYPVLKNETLDILVTGTTLAYARFIPCQGNV